MRQPKVGDKILVTRYNGKDVEPEIRTVSEIKSEVNLLTVDNPVRKYSPHSVNVEIEEGVFGDEWRFAVREGDKLVVTKMNGFEVLPMTVTAYEDEGDTPYTRTIWLEEFVIPGDELSDVLDLQSDGRDVWYFEDDYYEDYYEEERLASEVSPIKDICDSFNDVQHPWMPCEVSPVDIDVGHGYTPPRTYAEFVSGGEGVSVSDYTGVGFTAEELAFKSRQERDLETITPETLDFRETETDMVNHPSHYTNGSIEVIDMLEELAGSYSDPVEGYLAATVGKYLFRAEHKGNKTQDIGKATWYLNRLKERLEDE